MPSSEILLALILGYFGIKVMLWLVKQEHKGNYIDLHINFYGDCDYITYNGKRYYPDNLKGVLRRGR